MNLDTLGWGPTLANAFSPLLVSSPSLLPGRVVRQDRSWLRVQTARGLWLARASGRLRHEGAGPEDLPVIGDWVAVEAAHATDGGPADGPEPRTHIQALLPRQGLLTRRGADDAREAQPIAANVDVVLLVVGLDRPLNERWLERAATLAWDGGATPVMVLNKSDTAAPDAVARALAAASMAAPGVECLALSAQTGEGLDALGPLLAPGRTAALLGSSGVGKSSLVNRLLGDTVSSGEPLATGGVRDSDHKGRHTTTHRELRVLPGGALLIDGPGMRELGLWTDGDGLEQAFPDIEAWAQGCRFSDCTHEREPGCEVQAAVARGELDLGRLGSFEKLRREQAWLQARDSREGRSELRRKERLITTAAWSASRGKRRKD